MRLQKHKYCSKEDASVGSWFLFAKQEPYPCDFGSSYVQRSIMHLFVSDKGEKQWGRGRIRKWRLNREGIDVFDVLFEGENYSRDCLLSRDFYSARHDAANGSWYLLPK